MEVTLMEILAAREERAARQKGLLARFGKPLICFTMNIPGPEKCTPLIEEGFHLGIRRLRDQLKSSGIAIVHGDILCAPTGCEGYFCVDGDEQTVKNLCMEIEQADPLGRLFDIDVLDTGGRKLGRSVPRTCLICEKEARICGRSRAHSVAELQEKVAQILTEALNREDMVWIAAAAVKSLLYEVAVTPKPGLVDRDNSGSHRDMDIFSFLGSASALHPFFETCAAIGQAGGGLSQLRYPGKLAEGDMYRQTQGVNTHKGAIFSLGLLCCAAGQLGRERTAEGILQRCAQLAAGLTRELGQGDTAGQQLYKKYGVTGVRGQAEQGFPAVGQVGLPVLKQGLSQGLSLNDAAVAALLHMMTVTQDTNLIARSDPETAQAAADRVRGLLERSPFPGMEQVRELDRYFMENDLSPGGTADLLSLTLFLHFLEERRKQNAGYSD